MRTRVCLIYVLFCCQCCFRVGGMEMAHWRPSLCPCMLQSSAGQAGAAKRVAARIVHYGWINRLDISCGDSRRVPKLREALERGYFNCHSGLGSFWPMRLVLGSGRSPRRLPWGNTKAQVPH